MFEKMLPKQKTTYFRQENGTESIPISAPRGGGGDGGAGGESKNRQKSDHFCVYSFVGDYQKVQVSLQIQYRV